MIERFDLCFFFGPDFKLSNGIENASAVTHLPGSLFLQNHAHPFFSATLFVFWSSQEEKETWD